MMGLRRKNNLSQREDSLDGGNLTRDLTRDFWLFIKKKKKRKPQEGKMENTSCVSITICKTDMIILHLREELFSNTKESKCSVNYSIQFIVLWLF